MVKLCLRLLFYGLLSINANNCFCQNLELDGLVYDDLYMWDKTSNYDSLLVGIHSTESRPYSNELLVILGRLHSVNYSADSALYYF